MVGAQFTTGNLKMESFEHRIVDGCKQLCGQVHSIGTFMNEVKSAMYELNSNQQHTASTTNSNHATIQQLNSAVREANKRITQLLESVAGIKGFLEVSGRTIEDSYRSLEHNCIDALNKLAKHSQEQIDAQGVCIAGL